MAKKRLRDCRSGKDILKYVKKKDVVIKNGKGSHMKVVNRKGICIVPHHNKDLPKGTRHSILKTLAGMGITVLVLGAVLVQSGIL